MLTSFPLTPPESVELLVPTIIVSSEQSKSQRESSVSCNAPRNVPLPELIINVSLHMATSDPKEETFEHAVIFRTNMPLGKYVYTAFWRGSHIPKNSSDAATAYPNSSS